MKISFYVMLILLAIWLTIVSKLIISQDILFDGDEYLHSIPALEATVMFNNGQSVEAIKYLLNQDFYPPLHSILLTIAYLIFGVSLATSRILSVVLYFLMMVACALAVKRFLSKQAVNQTYLYSYVAISLLIGFTAYLPLLISTLCMLEPLAMLLVALILYVLTYFDQYKIKSAILIAVLLALLFFTKYTFPLLVFPALFLAIIYDLKNFKEFTIRFNWIVNILVIFFTLVSIWILYRFYGVYDFFFEYPARGIRLGIKDFISYPITMFQKFFINPYIAMLLAITILVAFINYSRELVIRLAFFSLLCSVLIFVLSSDSSIRHLTPLFPMVVFLSGSGAVYMLNKFIPNRHYFSFNIILLLLAIFLSAYRSFESPQLPIKKFMEYKPTTNEAIKTLSRNLQTAKTYIIIPGKVLVSDLNLHWLLAAKNNISISEAKAAKKSNQLFKEVNNLQELIDLTKSIKDKDIQLVFVNSPNKGNQHKKLFDEITNVCNKIKCKQIKQDKYNFIIIKLSEINAL